MMSKRRNFQSMKKDGMPSRRRRGIAALVVLLLLSITLALSYASMRTQSVDVMIHNNARRRPAAREAAVTGIAMALKNMSGGSWAGADSSFSGSISSYERFQVTYSTGDASLAPSNTATYSDYPYRVTLLSTGYSTDPSNAQNTSTYQIQVVVRLVPRALAAEPSNWSSALAYTIYQTGWNICEVAVPAQVLGPVYCQGWMYMSRDMQWSDTIRQRYYSDLNLYRTVKSIDWRPLTGTINITNSWPFGQYSDTLSILTSLGLSYSTMSLSWYNNGSWDPVTTVPTYRLYAGGKRYTAQTIGSSLQSVNLQPDMQNNPLGIYYSAGAVTLSGTSTIQGTLVTGGDVNLSGTSTFTPVTMPSLHLSTTANQLPAAVSETDFKIAANSNVTIAGQVAIGGQFYVAPSGQASTTLNFVGQLMAGSVYITGRSEWAAVSSSTWSNAIYPAFTAQIGTTGGSSYFPRFLQKHVTTYGLNPVPQLTIKPPTAAVRYHWQTWMNAQNTENPIFVPATGEIGLRWDLVSWKEL